MRSLIAFGALAAVAGVWLHGCGSDNCADTLTCEPADGGGGSTATDTGGGGQGQGGNTGGGGAAQGGNGAGGGTGGTGGTATCGNDTADAGELCFTGPATEFVTALNEGIVDFEVIDCNGSNGPDVVGVTASNFFVLINDGAGALSGSLSTGTFGTSAAIALGEFAPDGGATVGYNDTNYIDRFINNGSCSYTYNGSWYLGATIPIKDLAVGSLNATHDDIIATTEQSPTDKIEFRLDFDPSTDAEVNQNLPGPAWITATNLDMTAGMDIAIADEGFDRVAVRVWNGATFDNALITTTGTAPNSIASADMNGDQINDIVVTSGPDATISVLLNQGDGTLIRQTPDPATGADSPCSVALGDIDNDGDIDAATANCGSGTASISVLVNNGAGVLEVMGYESTSFPIAVSDQPTQVRLADLNNDGALDILVSHADVGANGSYVSVLLAQP